MEVSDRSNLEEYVKRLIQALIANLASSRKLKLKLAELVENLSKLEDDLVIYVPVSGDLTETSEVVACLEVDDGNSPATNLRYWLEVNIAKEVLQV